MNRIIRLFVCLSILIHFLFPQEYNNKPSAHNAEYIMGFNYSKLYSTASDGRFGFNFGVNKIKPLGKKWDFKYGFAINKKQSKQKNKSILYGSGMAGDYNYFSKDNIILQFIFLDLNFQINRNLVISDKFELYSILGSDFNLYMFHFTDVGERVPLDSEERPNSDYHSYTRETPFPILDKLENNGFSVKLGFGIKNQTYNINVIYEIDLFDINNVGKLLWEEKYHQINILFGFFVQ